MTVERVADNFDRYVSQGLSLVPFVSSFTKPLHTCTLITHTDNQNTQDSFRYALQDSTLVPVSPTITTHISSRENVSTISNDVSHNIHLMKARSKTRSMTGLLASLQPKDDLVHYAPNYIYSSMQSSHWANAIKDELHALSINNTWCLTTLQGGKIPVGCKCLFKIKKNSDGLVHQYKAILVAKGFSQKLGFEFQDTFSPVVKAPTVRIILTLALTHK